MSTTPSYIPFSNRSSGTSASTVSIQLLASHVSCAARNTRLILFPATHVTFETDSPEFRLLEQRIYVGNGRFIVDDEGLTVEYKISQVQA